VPERARITILADEPTGTIRPELFGHFIEHLGRCVDEGIWVGEESPIDNTGGFRTDVLDALRQLRIPVLRWPGGCYADDYHWEDGVGPRKDRPRRVNLWWGQNVETNAFGTHEFLRLCRYLGARPYLAGNVGSGTPREMRDWMEYCNYAGDSTLARRRGRDGSPAPFDVPYWGVGNENWGCGGNFCPEDYAREYKRFATYLTGFGTEPYLIACGPDGNKTDWTRRFLTKFFSTPDHFNRRLNAIAAHYYCGTAGRSATEFGTNDWYELLYKATLIERLILDQRATIDEFDPQRKLGLVIDEWGTWHYPTPGSTPLWQQSTIRDALCAAITLNAFVRQADKLVMCNIAQVANVLQSLVLTDGSRMLRTPTYHVFDLFKEHQGATALRTEVESDAVMFALGETRQQMPALAASASVSGGWLTLSVTNAQASLPLMADVCLPGETRGSAQIATLSAVDLTGHNSFDEPDNVFPRLEDADIGQQWPATFPPASVTVVRVRLG
jgi:alpha-L-arabinofuranosidase